MAKQESGSERGSDRGPARRPSRLTRQTNFAAEALRLNSYHPYLPNGYNIGSDYQHPADPTWKERADAATPPSLVLSMYQSLQAEGVIPSYDRPLNMVSYGSNIPTIERFLFDVDREHRTGALNLTAVDHMGLPTDLAEALAVSQTHPVTKAEHSFSFVGAQEESFHPTEPVDLIFSYRASLYYYLRGGLLIDQGKFPLAEAILQKYYDELSDTGAVVLDAKPHVGRDGTTRMSSSTASLLEDNREELQFANGRKFDDLFTFRYVGEGDERVMILQKKPKFDLPIPA